jgi:hypothetical protein
VQEPISGGIFLSYKCTSECKHCMYACSPRWKDDWISEKDVEKILTQLSGRIQGCPLGTDKIGVNYGVHFTGGEPFLNFDLLLKVVRMAHELRIPSTFVETNSFWCIDDKVTREKLLQLRDAGLHGILISVNPFILEQLPFERTERAVRIGREIFRENVILYQEFFYSQFKKLDIKDTLYLNGYLQKIELGGLYENVELLPIGRATYMLSYLYRKYPAKSFFSESCIEELTRGWHIHVDNYCNYMTGYCGGISLGDAREIDSICRGIDLKGRPILDALSNDLKRLFEFGVNEFDYKERKGGYISKCHLCVDVRRHIAQKTGEFEELRPREFYYHLE